MNSPMRAAAAQSVMESMAARVRARFRRSPSQAAAELGAIVAILLAIGVVSCQTWPAPVTASGEGAPPAAEPQVRVRVRTAATTTRIDGPAVVTVSSPGSADEAFRPPIMLTAAPDGLTLADERGQRRSYRPGARVDFQAAGPNKSDREPRALLRVDGRSYPGRLRAIARKAAPAAPDPAIGPAGVVVAVPPVAGAPAPPPSSAIVIDVIEFVGIEDYLPGVLAGEMPAGWPAAAYEVQAICARSYALHERQRALALGKEWDVEAGELDQAYSGTTQQRPAADAVRATRGVVLTWGGKLLRAYYSSTCGGRAASAADIWPISAGYEFNLADPLQARSRDSACQGSPRFRWEVRRDRAELARRMQAWGKAAGNRLGGVGLLKTLEVASANRAGRPSRYRLTDARGREFLLNAEELRVACNAPAPGLPAITRETRLSSGDVEARVEANAVVFKGRGFGHGVGMCQYCAKAFADRGEAWREMLPRFYPTAKIERAY